MGSFDHSESIFEASWFGNRMIGSQEGKAWPVNNKLGENL
jgi:hypothetical protein